MHCLVCDITERSDAPTKTDKAQNNKSEETVRAFAVRSSSLLSVSFKTTFHRHRDRRRFLRVTTMPGPEYLLLSKGASEWQSQAHVECRIVRPQERCRVHVICCDIITAFAER
jgi:hypothetical protein